MADEPPRITGNSLDQPDGGDAPWSTKVWKSTTALAGRFEHFDKRMENILTPGTGTLAKLEAALESLTKTVSNLDKNMKGGGGTGGGVSTGGAPSGGTNPHSGFNVQRGLVAAGSAALYGVGSAFSERTSEFPAMAPLLSQINVGTGAAFSTQGLSSRLGANPYVSGASGPVDVLTSAAAAQRMAGQSIFGPRGKSFGNSIEQLTYALPGIDRTQASQLLKQLTSPYATNTLQTLYGGAFVGRGGTATNPIATAYNIARATTGRNAPTTSQIGATFTPGGGAYQQLLGVLGSEDAVNSVVSLAQEQSNFRARGGRGTVDLNTARGRRAAGVDDPIVNAMRRVQEERSQFRVELYGSQARNVAGQISFEATVERALDKVIESLGPVGPIAAQLTKIANFFLGGPIAGVAGAFLGARAGSGAGVGVLSRLLGGGAAATGEGAVAGGVVAPVAGVTVGGIAASAADKMGRGTSGSSISGRSGPGAGRFFGREIPGLSPASRQINRAFSWLDPTGDPPLPIGGTSMHGRMNVGDPADDVLGGRNHSSDPQAISGLDPKFRGILARMFQDNPRLVLNSGFRSPQHQQQLWDEAVRKYGSAAAARKWVAPPGHSMHEKGEAADIGPSSEYGWLKANAAKYGLWNYPPEPWHWEPQGARQSGASYSPNDSSANEPSAAPTAGSTGAARNVLTASTIDIGRFGGTQGALMSALLGGATEQGANRPGVQVVQGGALGGGGGTGTAASTAGGGDTSAYTGSVNGGTWAAFARDALKLMGAPTSKGNIGSLLAWMGREEVPYKIGPNDVGAYNPFNYNKFDSRRGQFNFSSWQDGVANFVGRLTTNTHFQAYKDISAALISGADPHHILDLVQKSPWASGHYGGTLPGMYDTVLKRWDYYSNAPIRGIGDPPTGAAMTSAPTSVSVQGAPIVHMSMPIQIVRATEAEAMRLGDIAARRVADKLGLDVLRES